MEKEELKKLIAGFLRQGMSLPEIQNKLASEHKTTVTFLDLRLIASEIENIDWKEMPGEKSEAKESKEDEAHVVEDEDQGDEEISGDKGTWENGAVVEISKISRPGAMMSGSVKFPSGAKADWVLDNFGRIGLENATGKPTQEDIKEFQVALQKKVANQ